MKNNLIIKNTASDQIKNFEFNQFYPDSRIRSKLQINKFNPKSELTDLIRESG